MGWALALGACSGAEIERCAEDAHCGEHRQCVDAVCLCVDNAACALGQVCNPAGRCQAAPRCADNLDCKDGERCDLGAGACVADAGCLRDLDCALASVCEGQSCVPGCRGDEGCPLGQLCDGATTESLGACKVGCRSTSACRIGELCVGGSCYPNPNLGLCMPCGSHDDCQGASDWCLANRSYDPARPETGQPKECAIDCDVAAEVCPNGSSCRSVVLSLGEPCERDGHCLTGQQCLIEEGDAVGLCSCRSDADCTERLPATCRFGGFCEYPAGRLCGADTDCLPVDSCGAFGPGGSRACYLDPSVACSSGRDCLCLRGACVLTGRACASAADCPVACEGGGCVVGRGCAADEGLYCADVRMPN